MSKKRGPVFTFSLPGRAALALAPTAVTPLVTARFGVLFKSLNVSKTINIYLAHFRCLQSYKSL